MNVYKAPLLKTLLLRRVWVDSTDEKSFFTLLFFKLIFISKTF